MRDPKLLDNLLVSVTLRLSDSNRRNLEHRSGTRVKATRSEQARAKVTVSAWSLNRTPAIPGTNTIGRKTDMVVKVDAVMAFATSAVPTLAAARRSFPLSRCRKTLSSTTMALSTSRPTPSANPPIDIMLRVMPAASIATKVATTDVGIATAMIRTLRMLWRKKKSTRTANTPPQIATPLRLLKDRLINLDRSMIMVSLARSPSDNCSSLRTFLTRFTTSTVLESDCF